MYVDTEDLDVMSMVVGSGRHIYIHFGRHFTEVFHQISSTRERLTFSASSRLTMMAIFGLSSDGATVRSVTGGTLLGDGATAVHGRKMKCCEKGRDS